MPSRYFCKEKLMRVPRLIPAVTLHLICALLIATCALAQQAAPPSIAPVPQPAPPSPVHLRDYSQPRSAFPKFLQPYTPRPLEFSNLGNSPRIDALMRDGKIYLSIDDAVALALENNLDLEIARFNLNIADADLLRAKSGANILGINTGIVQNTPGGGVGGLGGSVGSGTGGTTVAAGGAGTGTSGLVGSTLGIGSPITSFDPSLTGTVQLDKNQTQSTSPFSPVPLIAQNTYSANFGYTQGFAWGGALTGVFNNTHLTTNNTTSLFTPQLGSNFQFRFTQNLLQGFGFLPNTRFIRIAKNNREISDVAFRLQIITTIDQVENMYWDLVYAYENVRVQQESLTYTQKALEDAKRQAQVGTVPPIQVVSAQSTVATGQQNLIVAQNNLQLQQLLMKNALSRSIEDPILAEADVIPTSTMQLPQQEPVTPIQDLINQALQHRAELVQTRIDLNSRDINVKSVRNSMLPTLQAFAYYGGSGLGGDVNPNCSFSGVPCYNPARVPPAFRGTTTVGYGGTLNQ
jgi:outer membrane protein TolC